MSYPSETLVDMARIWLPERFIIHSAEQFGGALDRVTAWFWYRETFGDVSAERPIGVAAGGSLDAIQWLAGIRPQPPGYDKPRERTRANLYRLAAAFELMVRDKEALLELDPEIDPYLDVNYAIGVLDVLEWAIGVSEEYPGVAMHPEQVNEAREMYRRVHQSRHAAA